MLTSHRLRRPLAAAALTVLAVAGCRDPFQIEAQFTTIEDVVTISALSGTPLDLPAAVLVAPAAQAVRPGPDFVFDIAFDIAADGTVQLFPVDVVARPGVVGGRTVGIQVIDDRSYEEITRAPERGYTYREPVTVSVGDAGVIQANAHPSCLASFLSTSVFAKFRVEAVDPATRTMRLRVRVDPNCGFRGLEEGTPSR
jgi:hypothetical protein